MSKTVTADLVKTANGQMAEYVTLNENIKAMEARKETLRAAILGLVDAGVSETEDYAATVSPQTRRSLKVDEVIAKFGEDKVKPLIKVTNTNALTVRRKAESTVTPPAPAPKKHKKK